MMPGRHRALLGQDRAVFLDRDGVLNKVVFRNGAPASPRTLQEFRFIEGISGALERLRGNGLRLFVVTNQPDVARGLLDAEVLGCMTRRLLEELPIERVLVCTHDDCHACACRKPKPGMLFNVASREQIDLVQSFMVGDSWKDTAAAHRAGCRSVLLRREYNVGVTADLVAGNLDEAVELILG